MLMADTASGGGNLTTSARVRVSYAPNNSAVDLNKLSVQVFST
jgi:hypothetical protein